MHNYLTRKSAASEGSEHHLLYISMLFDIVSERARRVENQSAFKK
jgi:hypothetical protein